MLLKYYINKPINNYNFKEDKNMAFNFFRKKKDVEKVVNGVNFSQEEKIAQGRKELAIVMNKLAKETGVDLSQLVVRVAVVMDHSGSMESEYDNGTVQKVLNLFFPFAILLDDNKSMEIFLFDDICRRINENMNMQNYSDYVRKYIYRKYPYGGTVYSSAIRETDCFYNDQESQTIPTLVFFITDGGNFKSDEKRCDDEIINSSEHGIFYMCVGVGNNSFTYLRHLDDLKGRKRDNTGFMQFEDFQSIESVEMFTQSLKDFIPWLKAKGYVR